MKRTQLLIAVLLLNMGVALGQDIHLSQFHTSPLTLNPAMTGVFNGDFRFAGIYRNQWGAFVAPFKTFAASYDMHLFRNRLEKDIMGIGLVALSDKAGQSELGTNRAAVSLAYSKALSESPDNFLTVGMRGGFVQRSFNLANLTFDNQYDGDNFDPGASSGETFPFDKQNYVEVSAGLMWYYLANSGNNMYAGIGMFHINKPRVKSFTGNQEQIFTTWVIHGGGQIILDSRLALLPSFMVLREGPFREINFGTYFRIKVKQDEETAFYLGSWHRISDAIIPAVRMDYRNFSLGFSYDINTSGLNTVSNGRGGPEISLVYIGSFPGGEGDNGEKKSKRIRCPTF